MNTTFCKKYPKDEVLPDEKNCCSLCSSSLDMEGNCTHDSTLANFNPDEIKAILSEVSTQLTQVGGDLNTGKTTPIGAAMRLFAANDRLVVVLRNFPTEQ